MKRPIVRFSEEDRVEYKGWLGMIRELQEDRNMGTLDLNFLVLEVFDSKSLNNH